MKVIKHNIYVTPMVKAVAFRVEHGFESSPVSSDNETSNESGFEEMQEYQGTNNSLDGSYF